MKNATKESEELKLVNPKFIPDSEKISERVYSNYVVVSHTGLDFTLIFLDVAPPNKEQFELAKKNKEVPAPVQCQIVLPNEVIPSLIEALKKQYEKYESNQSTSATDKSAN